MKPCSGAAAAVLIALLGGCVVPPGNVAKPSAPEVTATPVATEPTVDPAPLRVEPVLRVRTAKATRLYTGPGPWYLLIRELAADTVVAYQGNREGWLRVRTSTGEVGWLTVADAELTDGRGQDVTYGFQGGRWVMRSGAGPTLEAVRVGTGLMRVTMTGLTGPAEVVAAGQDALWIRSILPPGLAVAGEIGDSGVSRVSLTSQGVLIDLEGRPFHQVVEQAEGRLVIEIRPGLTGLAPLPAGGWALTYRGDMRPVLREEGADLVLDLPGAVLAPGLGPVPGLVTVGPEVGPAAASPTAPGAMPPARMPVGGLRFRVPAPAGPFALYRPAPGRFDLRFLPPGLAGKTVVIDPGHGGEETGAVGPEGQVEKDVNLAIALRLRDLLAAVGAKVLLTRAEDRRVLPPDRWSEATSAVERTQLDLAARSTISNSNGADLFVSIHANGGPPGDGGTEVYWAVSNLNAALSQRLARFAQQELLAALGLADRGFKQRPFNVIRMAEAPAMLVETAFITEPGEEHLLASAGGQQAAAHAIARAIQRYFGG